MFQTVPPQPKIIYSIFEKRGREMAVQPHLQEFHNGFFLFCIVLSPVSRRQESTNVRTFGRPHISGEHECKACEERGAADVASIVGGREALRMKDGIGQFPTPVRVNVGVVIGSLGVDVGDSDISLALGVMSVVLIGLTKVMHILQRDTLASLFIIPNHSTFQPWMQRGTIFLHFLRA